MLQKTWLRLTLTASLLLSGCATAPPIAQPGAAKEPAQPHVQATIPAPGTALLLRPAKLPAEGVPYRLTLRSEGQQQMLLSAQLEEPEPSAQEINLQLDFRELPAAAGAADPESVSLVMEAMHHHQIATGSPPRDGEVELANDRLRVMNQKKPGLDLRGAQPKEELTPRVVLGKPFAILRPAVEGGRVVATIRGTPPGRKFLKPFGLHEVLRWARVGLPDTEVTAGSTWEMPRFPTNPAGGVGLELPIHYELVGFQTVDGVPCAWIRISSELDAADVASAGGLRFDRVHAKVNGEAYVELETRLVRRVVLEDDVRASWKAGRGTATLETRIRYRTRTELQRRDSDDTTIVRWADGTKAFDVR
jgi:hypothetical protein